MIDLAKLKKDFENCSCGVKHELNVKDIRIGSKITAKTGEILRENNFPTDILFVADKNTLAVADGILPALKGFNLTKKIYENLREATVKEVNVIKELLSKVDGVISVGTGSLNDICRMAAAELDKPLCIFVSAASVAGVISYNAPPIAVHVGSTDGNFKVTYAAKTPESIIADTAILASSPTILKGAGFGDMVGKYVGLIDWQVSHLITGEYYCEKVAMLTKSATDRIMALADRVTLNDEESAAAVFEALLLTGIGMSFTKTSRPASGTEHILSHFWECKKLLDGELSDFHGRKVGVATLLIMDKYGELLKRESVKAHKEIIDWEDVYANYGELSAEVKKLNTPDTITDGINPADIEEKWGEIRKIIASVPSKEKIYSAMVKAGAATNTDMIAVSNQLKEQGLKYHPYMRRRLSLYRLSYMLED